MTIVDEQRPVRRFPLWAAAGLVLALVVAAGGWWAYDRWRDRAPFSESEVEATAVVRFTEWESFEEDAGAIGAKGLGARPAGALDDRLFLGRVELTAPAVESGDPLFYHVLVIDQHHDRAASLGNLVGSRPAYLAALPERYPWLAPLARTGEQPQAWFVEAPAAQTSVISFAGSVPDGTDMTAEDLMVVLVLAGQDGTAHWVKQVTG